ncbi:protein Daple-like isoform X2 [Zophobas morio]|uniref:protein Daple-like isoform X2 n=1 Tax=Zophobas morio TaxID=2755281 RepID=UPI0030831E19
MKKILNKKFPTPSKLVSKVFQRQKPCNADSNETQMTTDASLIKEVDSLKAQVDGLKDALNALKLDTENKEIKLAKLAREKEKLSMSLAKVRRSNDNLAQQLESERNFYYKEKESYCQEMNEYKKLKKVLSNSNISTRNDGEEVSKLKKTLEHTLQTNYNLSVKFLRMKETKNLLVKTLDQTEEEHKRVVEDFRYKIDTLTSEFKEILNQKFDAPLSPSNKKYLQLVNQNSSLVYENLYLQMQLDQVNLKLRRDKILQTKSETNARIQQTAKEKRAKKLRSPHRSEDCKIIKIFEREKQERKLQLPVVNESKLEVFQVSEVQSRSSVADLTGSRKRSRSAPKIVQSATFTPTMKTKNEK